jgi:hypothetical protein
VVNLLKEIAETFQCNTINCPVQILNWSEFDILSLFGILAIVKENLCKFSSSQTMIATSFNS